MLVVGWNFKEVIVGIVIFLGLGWFSCGGCWEFGLFYLREGCVCGELFVVGMWYVCC